jgi:hypothetical protein
VTEVRRGGGAAGTGHVTLPVSDVDVVYDLEAARAQLIARGAGVSEVFTSPAGRTRPGSGRPLLLLVRLVQRSRRQPLAAPGDQDTASGPLSLTEEDEPMDVAALADLLRETAEHHDPYEKRAPKHDWWDWYAAYMIARQQGTTPEEASTAAGRYMTDVKHIVSQ